MADLKKTLGPVQFFSIGFGGIVGVGWIVYMGLWFSQAGPIGTMIAFLVGGLLMALIGLCYAELGAMYPVAGAEAVYGYRAFGQFGSFAVGWAMVLMMTAVVPYVSIGLAWLLDALIPGIAGPELYTWRGQPIRALGLAISVGWTLWLGVLNYRGIQGAARFQDWLTYGKVAISLLFVGAAILLGSTANLRPMFQHAANGSVAGGLMAVLATTPWFFGGFNMIPQVFEERAEGTSARTLGLVVVFSILAAATYTRSPRSRSVRWRPGNRSSRRIFRRPPRSGRHSARSGWPVWCWSRGSAASSRSATVPHLPPAGCSSPWDGPGWCRRPSRSCTRPTVRR